MKQHALLLALLSSCGPLAELPPPGAMEPLVTADAGPPAADAGKPRPPVTPIDAGVMPDGGAPPMTGLPCEVRTILETHCTSCHGGQTYIRPLVTRDALLALRLDSTQRLGEFALQRMQPNAAYPMPPAGYTTQVSAAELAVMASWVNAGMPGGACGTAQ